MQYDANTGIEAITVLQSGLKTVNPINYSSYLKG